MSPPVRARRPGLRPSIRAALANLATFGDTDIFHEPFELQRLRRDPESITRAVMALHRVAYLNAAGHAQQPCLRSLVPAGPHGFRLGTLLDPVWNIYYLALTLGVAPPIEQSRPRAAAGVVSGKSGEALGW